MTTQLEFLTQLNDSEYQSILSTLNPSQKRLAEQIRTKGSRRPAAKIDERTYIREYQAKRRAAERDLRIPIPAEPNRRLDCLAEPKLYFQTYFPETFFELFTEDREAMLVAIVHAAQYAGDYAVAGPRSEGKTKIAVYGSQYLMTARLTDFPLVIGKSQTKSEGEIKTIKQKLQQNKLFIADFPEIGIPFQSVGGWSSRGRMQTVAGEFTNIEIGADHFIYPTIERWQLPDNWPDNIEPASRGQIMGCMGIDGPVRGTNYYDRRPTLAIIEDIESRESAESDKTIEANEDIIDKDIAGLGSGSQGVSRIMLCTIQNRKCIAYKYTDPAQKHGWKKHRFRRMIQLPDRMDLWQKYMELVIERDPETDPDARVAHQFYLDNREAMDAGCKVNNPCAFISKPAKDGRPIEVSAIQSYFNLVARLGQDAVDTEYNNDPPAAKGPEGSGLTKEIVASRISGLAQRQVPANTSLVTVGIDLGKYSCHWVTNAWWKGAGGCVADYGIAEVVGTNEGMDNQASEPMILRCLFNLRDQLLSTPLVDASGTERKIDKVFIDSGTFTDAAYEFVRQVGHPFYVCKGDGNYRDKKTSDFIRGGKNQYAAYQHQYKVWLFMLHTDYWKKWVHERFLTPTFDENNMLRRGALSLFLPVGNKKHSTFSRQIVAEELVTEFKQGKGEKSFWQVVNRNNHWLDAEAMAAAAAGSEGIDVLSGTTANPDGPKVEPKRVDGNKPKPVKQQYQHGRFRTRPGGWVNGARRR